MEETLEQMPDDLILMKFDRIVPNRAYTVFVLGNEEKQFAIYTEPQIGRMIQMQLAGLSRTRPMTHDLLLLILKGLDVSLLRVVITDMQDTVYFAKLCLEQKQKDLHCLVEIDARPSDCITLAVMMNVPIYCTRELFERVIPFYD
ncbi:bifunctional nuclease family protein [Candidatus Similichlamydia laticola]|uniref:bifunctional nuclease family protein n=1 Tax=Candidatus Similichlamydia laticola TaxID=2170265 RepID=UPI001FE2F09C|nr:bifunctional nuclease domain-containing protein [Candidatus Similichlamydia laticola]